MAAGPHLDPKTRLLVALGSAAAAKCQVCFTTLYATASSVEATDAEIRAAVAIASKVVQKSHQFMAAFIDETTKASISARSPENAEADCPCE